MLFSFHDRWVQSNQVAGNIGTHTQYNYESITPSPLVSGSSFSTDYIDPNSGVTGVVVQDTVNVGGISTSMQFGAATSVGVFTYADSILAMGWSPGSSSTLEYEQ